MSEEREIYQLPGCHEHGSDTDGGVPFWKRAAVTDGHLAVIKKDAAAVRKAAWAVVDGFEASDLVLQEFEQRVARLRAVLEGNVEDAQANGG